MSQSLPPDIETSITQNLATVRQSIHEACQRAGRASESVKLVAVTKQRTPEEVIAALKAGVRHIGENRVEDAAPKIAVVNSILPKDILAPTWHMIGHVQSRKADGIIQNFQVIHSVDSVKIARRYDNFVREFFTKKAARPQILIEINISGEATKEGLLAHRWKNDPSQRHYLWTFIKEMAAFTHLQLVGLMTLAPYEAEAEQTRPIFAGLRELFEALKNDFPTIAWRELSMGMTNDYPIAIEEGATMVRIGRAIFGERPR